MIFDNTRLFSLKILNAVSLLIKLKMCLLCDYYPLILVFSVQISLLKGMLFSNQTSDRWCMPAARCVPVHYVASYSVGSKEMFLVFQIISSFYHRVPTFIYIWGLLLNKFHVGKWFQKYRKKNNKILRGDDVEVWHSICQQIWKTQQWP